MEEHEQREFLKIEQHRIEATLLEAQKVKLCILNPEP